MANANNLLDFQDPGKLSEELLDMPGFVNELTDYTLSQAHSSNRALAFLGATAMQAHLAERTYADTLMILRKRLADSELFTARALVVRMNEKIAKLAMIRAISGSPEKPVITGEGVRWAAQFVTHVTKAMLHEAQFHVSEGKFDALVKRFLGLLTKHGGTLDRRTLIKNLHVDYLTFRRIVMTLHMSDSIIEESESGRNTLYTIKNAA